MLVGVVGWIVLGLIVGFIATKFVALRGDDPRLGMIAAGVGALVGGILYSYFSGTSVTPFNPRSLLFACTAAVVVLIAWHGWRWKIA